MSYYLVSSNGRIVGEVDNYLTVFGLAQFEKGCSVSINFWGGPLHLETKTLALGRKFSHGDHHYEVVRIGDRWFGVVREQFVGDYRKLAEEFDAKVREQESERVLDEVLAKLNRYSDDFLQMGWDRVHIHFNGKNWSVTWGAK